MASFIASHHSSLSSLSSAPFYFLRPGLPSTLPSSVTFSHATHRRALEQPHLLERTPSPAAPPTIILSTFLAISLVCNTVRQLFLSSAILARAIAAQSRPFHNKHILATSSRYGHGSRIPATHRSKEHVFTSTTTALADHIRHLCTSHDVTP